MNKAQSKPQAKASKPRSDKICLRFNDGICQSKNCNYAHRCIACEEWGHSKKSCGNVDKKKEGK